MQKTDILLRFLSSVLQVPVICLGKSNYFPDLIEKKYCFSSDAQPYLTANGIKTAASSIEANTLYYIKDSLQISILLFRLISDTIWVGPVVTNQWEEKEAKLCLAHSGLAMGNLVPYKLYYCGCGLWDQNMLLRIVYGAISAALPDVPPYQIQTFIKCDSEKTVEQSGKAQTATFDDSVQRYDLENQFIAFVEKGNLSGALEIYTRLQKIPVQQGLEYTNYIGMITNVAALRTMTRKAAEKGGVHPAIVDAISLSYARKAASTHGKASFLALNQNMIREFCEAVQAAQAKKYSSNIRDTIAYLNLHICENVSRKTLALALGCDPVALSRRFKNETGCTLAQYVAQERCRKAAYLLTQTNLSIQEISAHVGYLDNNYFVKVFKKYMQDTPTGYRKKFHIL